MNKQNSTINFKKISSANIPSCVPPVCRHQVIRDLWAFQPAVKATPVGFCNFPGKTAAKHQTSDKGIQYYLSSWPQLPWRFVKLDCQCLNYQNFHRVSSCLITSFVFHDFCHVFATSNLCCPPKSFCIAWACHLWLNIPPFSVDFFGFHTPLQPTAVDGPPVTWSKSNPMWVPWCKEKLTILWLLPNLGR